MNKKQTDKIHQIIKYKPYREYVCGWTPNRIHNKYWEAHSKPGAEIFVSIGGLSMQMVVDALWNEMSYNPVRFGTQTPFEIPTASWIKSFCRKISDTDNKPMMKITYELSKFIDYIGTSYPEFYKTSQIPGASVLIKCDHNRKPNCDYMALSCLVRAIHLISTQNLHDYRINKFRKQIVQVAASRHPNLERPKQYCNFITSDRLMAQKNSLYSKIREKTSEIFYTEMRIKALSDYEAPVDVSDDRAALAKKQSELHELETVYDYVCQQYEQMMSHQNGNKQY